MNESRKKKIFEWIESRDLPVAVLEGFDDCIIGLDEITDKAVYSKSMIMDKLTKQGWEIKDATEYYEYNILLTAEYMGIKIVNDTF